MAMLKLLEHSFASCSPRPVDLSIVVDLLLDVHLAVRRAKAANLILLLIILPATT
jgi:hypothetical protein